MTTLELRFLGSLSIHQAGRSLTTLKSQKGQVLLCYLALTGKAHSRSALAGLLWPEMPEDNALMSLRTVLNKLNHHLAPHLAITRQTIAFQAASSWVDVTEFEAGVTSRSDTGRMQAAVALYQGDFLEGFYMDDAPHFDGWALGQRARLRQAALDGLRYLVGHFADGSEHETAITYARQLLSIEPWREEAHRDLMRLLALSGQRSAALVQYETCRRILAEELAVEPASATVSLYEQIKDNRLTPTTTIGLGQASFLRLPSDDNVIVGQRVAAVPLHNLPAQTTPFIGREAELAALAQYLADPTTRLITILGPGGIGKTRLALAAAEAQVNDQQQPALFPQGVYFVSLAGLETANLLAPAIAEALNFRFAEGDEPKAQLLRYLRQKAMLLILDNFEHLRAGAGLVDEIVQTAPGIKLFVTSREKLNRQAEQLFPIGGMALPHKEEVGEQDSTALSSYSAIQLFCHCARRVRPDFTLTAESQSHVLGICRLVQGMPLGIVLAATWLEVLTPSEIVAEMSRNLDFLATDMADVPERQRSLRAAFNHSWRLLSQQEQHIFRQLSTFRGGFTREAAEAVTGASLRDLQALVNKSLLNRTSGGRYEIHELLRQFGAEKLAQAPEVEAAVRDRHSAHYCAFLHEHTEHWQTGRQLETLAVVTQEADNVRVAWRRALDQEEWQRLVQAVDSWGWFLDWQGRFTDGESFCQAIVAKAERQSAETTISPECLRLWARALAWLGWFTSNDSTALRRFQQSMALLERLELAGQDTRQEKAFVLKQEAFHSLYQDLQQARQRIERSLVLYQELGNQWGIAWALEGLSSLDALSGKHDAALDNVQAALAIRQEQGDQQSQAVCLTILGQIHNTLGHLEEAERWEREALSLSQQIGDRSSLVFYHAILASTLLWQGRFAEAQQLAEESLAICRELGHRGDEGLAQYYLCEILVHRGQYEPARRQAADGLLVVKAIDDRMYEAALYGVLGQLALVASSYAEAQAAFAKSAEIYGEINYRLIERSLAGLGYTACRLGQLQEARQHLTAALASALAVKNYGRTLFALSGVILLLARTGETARAVEIWALAKCHPFVANSKWFEDVAGRELEALAATLPPEVAAAARERGQRLELWPTAEALLAELEIMKVAER